LAILLAAHASAQPGPAKPVQPTEVARQFYDWYLRALDQNKEPLTQDPNGIRKYVAASFLADINRRMKSPDGLDADPFLQAQDFPEDWKDHVSVTQRRNTGVLASTIVTLGTRAASLNKLTVDLRKEAGIWKIVKVERLYN